MDGLRFCDAINAYGQGAAGCRTWKSAHPGKDVRIPGVASDLVRTPLPMACRRDQPVSKHGLVRSSQRAWLGSTVNFKHDGYLVRGNWARRTYDHALSLHHDADVFNVGWIEAQFLESLLAWRLPACIAAACCNRFSRSDVASWFHLTLRGEAPGLRPGRKRMDVWRVAKTLGPNLAV